LHKQIFVRHRLSPPPE